MMMITIDNDDSDDYVKNDDSHGSSPPMILPDITTDVPPGYSLPRKYYSHNQEEVVLITGTKEFLSLNCLPLYVGMITT